MIKPSEEMPWQFLLRVAHGSSTCVWRVAIPSVGCFHEACWAPVAWGHIEPALPYAMIAMMLWWTGWHVGRKVHSVGAMRSMPCMATTSWSQQNVAKPQHHDVSSSGATVYCRHRYLANNMPWLSSSSGCPALYHTIIASVHTAEHCIPDIQPSLTPG
jgi:hypothetical protein